MLRRPRRARRDGTHLAGVTYQQKFIWCSNRRCKRCATSKTPPHGPYWYAFFRTATTKGRLRSKYIGKKLPPEVNAMLCDRQSSKGAELRRALDTGTPNAIDEARAEAATARQAKKKLPGTGRSAAAKKREARRRAEPKKTVTAVHRGFRMRATDGTLLCRDGEFRSEEPDLATKGSTRPYEHGERVFNTKQSAGGKARFIARVVSIEDLVR